MDYKIQLRDSALLELESALNYYLEINPQIAFNFNEEIEEGFSALSISPFFEVRIENFRVFPLRKFPFILIFEILEVERVIDIISIFHTSQNPENYPT